MGARLPQRKESVLALPCGLRQEWLDERWRVELHPPETTCLTFWDSFEWGVWFAGRTLFSCGRLYRLCLRQGDGEGWPGPVRAEERAAGRRRFWDDFRSDAMRGELEVLLGLRGLARVAEGTWHTTRCDLRNPAGKIVCRLEWSRVCAGSGDHPVLHYCRVSPLLGYQAEESAVLDLLRHHGARLPAGDPLELLLQHAGSTPRKYTLRPGFGLKKETPARQALGSIGRGMLQIAALNLSGIACDLDTEFLHDFRICLRKVRSLLSLVKGVYPAEEALKVRRLLAELARETNRLRDLDVYLLAREEFRELLPPPLKDAIEPMFKDFSAQRGREARRVAAWIQGDAAGGALRELQAFFAADSRHDPAPLAGQPLGPLVFRRIYRHYGKIRRLGAAIGADTPDEAMHELRIECKKLRYLMEFFAELVPDEDGGLQKQLRRLQGNLGDFNDASVQQRSLLDYWRKKRTDGEVSLGIGALVSVLYRRQQQSRERIMQALQEFLSEATARAFKRTFKQPAPRA